MNKSTIFGNLVLVCSLMISACDADMETQSVEQQASSKKIVAEPAGVGEEATDSEQLSSLIREFSAGYYKLNPDTAVNNGLHEFDGQVPDYSVEGIQKGTDWYKTMRDRLGSIDDGSLSDREWLYKEQMEFAVDATLFYLEDMHVMENNAWYGYYALDPDTYLSRAYAPLDVRMRAFVKHVNGINNAVPHIKGNLKPMPTTYANVMKNFLAGLGEFITTTPGDIFAEAGDSQLQADMIEVTTRTAKSLDELAAWIDTQTRDEDFALNRNGYTKMLWALERIDTPVEELKSIAEEDLQRNLQAMHEVCAEFSPGTSIDECTAKVYANKFVDGPVKGATRQLTMLKQILIDKEIVSIPSKDVALVAEAPPHQRSNAAYMTMPGPYEKGMPAIYYIAPPDPNWSEEEQLSFIPGKMDLLATSVHEVWPGHFLEGLHSNQSGNPITELAYSYAFSEGWAHYTEEMMADEALEYDPEMKIGQLLNALLRNVRFISSLGLHTGGMTIEESERLFRVKGLQDPGNARQQAARGTFDPGYLFYTVGKLMIKKLRSDWMKKHPEKSLKDFHDKLLSYGSAPVPLIRKMMLGRDDKGKLF